MTVFRILHLSDLHLSEGSQWDTVDILTRAKDSVKDLCDQGLRPDLIAITGDLTHRGTKTEWELVRRWIDSTFLSPDLGFEPRHLAIVPGNHDVDRSSVSAGARALQEKLRSQATQQAIAEVFADPHDRTTMLRRHSSYLAFQSSLMGNGIENPWWSTDHVLGAINIRIVGICSSWMSCSSDDKGRLAIGRFQFSQMPATPSNTTIRIALLHHPIDYLQDFDAEDTLVTFQNDFDLVLRGHLHTQSTTTHLGPDNGFLELAAGALYSGGSYPNAFQLVEVYPERAEIKVHLRTWHKKKWITDRNAYQNAPQGIAEIKLPQKHQATSTTTVESYDAIEYVRPAIETQMFGPEEHFTLFDSPPAMELATRYLSSVPRYPINLGKHYAAVRQTARAESEAYLRKHRIVWVTADWDVGRRSFVGSLVSSFSLPGEPLSIFHLKCDDVDSGDDMLDCVAQQFGMQLQEFSRWVVALPQVILVLEDVKVSVMSSHSGENKTSLERIVGAILDYCPNISIILIGRSTPPADSNFPVVDVQPLDQIEIREYMKEHPQHPIHIEDLHLLDRISMVTEGIPRNIDLLLESVQISSLEEAIAMIPVEAVPPDSTQSSIPRALMSAIEKLEKCEDDVLRRSYRLLLALSVLDAGEPLAIIKRMYGDAPFWEQHAKRLMDLSLLDAIPIAVTPALSSSSASSIAESQKLLRVPRAIRDFVRARLSKEQHYDVVRAAANVLFGRDWRSGRIRLVKRTERAGGDIGPSNEHIVCMSLVRHAINIENKDELRRAMNVALKFCIQLHERGRWRDGFLHAKDLLGLLAGEGSNEDEYAQELAELRIIGAKCARMIGRNEEAVELLTGVLTSAKVCHSNSRLVDVYLTLSLAYATLKSPMEAIQAARRVCDLSPRTSAEHMQAKSIIIGQEKQGAELDTSLLWIETRARKKGFDTVADNISLDRATRCTHSRTRLECLGKVISGDGCDYNKVRAHVRRVNALIDEGLGADVSSFDLRWIERGYTYCFRQRMTSLFDECHKALWRLFKTRDEVAGLLKLFRHSSFLWRLRGDEEGERRCLLDLLGIDAIDRPNENDLSIRREVRYVVQRRVVLIISAR